MIKHGADGYYLFIYSSISAIENVVRFSPRHDHNMSLWEKKQDRVSLLRHWEFERLTGMKHHMISFFNLEEARHFINTLLSEFNLTLDDINDIIGTPGLSSKGYLTDWNHPDSVTYHALCHLYSGLLMDSEKFFNDNILAISIDGGSDTVIERDAWGKNMFAVAICQKGKIRFSRFPASARLWSQASQINNMAEGSLMALATAVIDKSFDIAPYLAELRKTDIYNTTEIDRLYEKLELIAKDQSLKKTDKSGNMNQFSSSDIYLSTLMKAIQFLSVEMTSMGIRHIVKQFNINTSEYYLSISGGYSLNCPNNTEMMKVFSFKGQLIPPCGNDSGQSIGMALDRKSVV